MKSFLFFYFFQRTRPSSYRLLLGQFYINLLLTALENSPEPRDITICLVVRSSNPRGRFLHATSNLFHFFLGGSHRYQIVIRQWIPTQENDPFFHVTTQLCYIQIGCKITRWCLYCHQPITTHALWPATPHIFFCRFV